MPYEIVGTSATKSMTIATIVEYLESWEINQYTVKIRAETSVALS